MSETVMTLCDSCAERMDANRHSENKYFLEEVPGSARPCRCAHCDRYGMNRQYTLESKASRAMRREYARRKGQNFRSGKDTRAHWREPWRGENM